MTTNPDDKEWRTYFLEEMRALRREQAEARAANSTENKEIRREVAGLRVEFETLKERSRLWSSLANSAGGAVAGAAVSALAKIFKLGS